MPKQSAKVEFNNFVAGFITEASELNFPPNASLDEENFEAKRKGTRSRRLGLNYETGHTKRALSITDSYLTQTKPAVFLWFDVAGDTTTSFLVVQAGNVLYFHDITSETLSTDGYISSLTISEFPSNVSFSFASVDGRLVIVAGYEKIAIVEYSSGVFSITYDSLQTRDIWGIEV